MFIAKALELILQGGKKTVYWGKFSIQENIY